MLSDRVGLSRDMREKTDRYREREKKRNSDSGRDNREAEVVDLVHFSDRLRC
jgi:hypothetical protein